MIYSSSRFRAASPWLAALTGTLSFVLFSLSDTLSLSIGLFGAIYLSGLLFLLATLCLAPFAVAYLWGQRRRLRVDVRVPVRLKEIDGSRVAQHSLGITDKIAQAGLWGLGEVRHVLQRIAGHLTRYLQGADWRGLRRIMGQLLAYVVITPLPLIVIVGAAVAFNIFPPLRSVSPAFVVWGLMFSAPLLMIATVGLKTKADMPRVFSYSPEFLRGFAKVIMIAGPVLAVVMVVAVALVMAPHDRGWLLILGPLYGGMIIGTAFAIGGVIAILEAITRGMHNKRPPPPNRRSPPPVEYPA